MNTGAPLPWHERLWTIVREAQAQERLSHALLLAGPSGVGKRDFARRLAASLLCESRGADALACGNCRGCVQLAADTHPNLHWVRPLYDEKNDKQKREISVEQLRELIGKLTLTTHYGGARVVVFDPADTLNVNGVNALLKTIEEPPPNTFLLLVSERPQALAATLRSRCQRLRFAPPETAVAVDWLRTQAEAPAAAAIERLLAQAQGAPLRALEAHRSGLAEQQAQWRRELIDVAGQKRAPTAAAVAVGRDRDQVAAWLRHFIGLLAELLRSRVAGAAAPDLATVASQLAPQGLQLMLDEAHESARRIHTSATPQMVVESLMIAWWRWTMARPGAAR